MTGGEGEREKESDELFKETGNQSWPTLWLLLHRLNFLAVPTVLNPPLTFPSCFIFLN